MSTRWRSALAASAILAGVVWGATPAAAEVLPCSEYPVTVCDSDGDGITDLVESAICDSATCATGTEDSDGDGTPDAVTLQRMLDGGGPGGAVQFPVFGEVLVVRPNGTLVQLAWLPTAIAVIAAAALVTASVIFIRRGRAQ